MARAEATSGEGDLVATVAHEFRTPLTSLQMAIHLCVEQTVGPLTEKQANLLFAAREDCGRLQGIVDELLDLSRIQAGRVDLRPRAAGGGGGARAGGTPAPGRGAPGGLRSEVLPGAGSVWADAERL